jgi:hypothetical protein
MLRVLAWYTKGLQIGIWHHLDIEFPTPNLVLVGNFDEKFKSKTFQGPKRWRHFKKDKFPSHI